MVAWDEQRSEVLEMLMTGFIKEMGRLIKQAREDKGYTQGQLAKFLKRRQAYISDLETGKTEATASILISLSMILEKPATYFMPENSRGSLWGNDTLTEGELSIDESEILKLMRQLEPHLTNYRIAQHLLRAFIDFEAKAQNEYFAQESERDNLS